MNVAAIDPTVLLEKSVRRKQRHAAYMRQYYRKNSAYRAGVIARSKAWKHAHRESVLEAGRKYAEKHRAQRAAWNQKNKASVRRSKARHELKCVADLTDSYLRKNIARQAIPAAWVTPEMIHLKRAILQIKRHLKP